MMRPYETTVEKIKAKCVECGDCWEWQGLLSKSNNPKINVKFGPHPRRDRTVVSTRRVVWELVKGEIPERKLVTNTCGNPKCLNPEHLKLTNHAQVAEKNGARLDVKLRRAAKSKGRNAKLTLQQATEIRDSEATTSTLAAEYGVSTTVIRRIVRQEIYQEPGNPFAALIG